MEARTDHGKISFTLATRNRTGGVLKSLKPTQQALQVRLSHNAAALL